MIAGWRAHTGEARVRVRDALWPAVQAAVGAGLAWWIAHSLLHHPEPFFAPIAAAVSLSTIPVNRGRRALQLLGGVLVGIAVAEGVQAVASTSAVSIGVAVVLTLVASLLLGAGLFGEGMMFVNQAAASAILVVALHHHGTGAERAFDAVIGAASAYTIGAVLFPSHPLRLLHEAERSVLGALGRSLGEIVEFARAGTVPSAEWTLRVGLGIHRRLARLAQARGTAASIVAMAPRRWGLRSAVAAESRRVAQVDLLANAVLSLVRSTTTSLEEGAHLSDELVGEIAVLGASLAELSHTPQPWPPQLVVDLGARMGTLVAAIEPATTDRGPVVASVARRAAHDLLAVLTGPSPGP